MTLTDGTELSPALGIGAFIEKTLVAAGQCTKVDPQVDATTVGLLGCGVMAGFGAAVNTGGVSRGDSVAVIGCGGVGNAAIAGAAVAGATTIIAVDVHVPALGVVFTGDTLFAGGPGATGRSYSDFPTIIDSISDKLLKLPPQTVVHAGHGDDTTIGAEAPHLQERIARGH